MELRQLHYFLAVVDEQHFGRAAEKLGIAQPGLSQRIKALERSLGSQLLIRDVRHVVPTETGEILAEEARRIVALADRAQQLPRLVEQEKRGLLKVATEVRALHPRASLILKEFEQRFGDVKVELHPGFPPGSLEALRRHVVDVAFLSMPIELPAGMCYEPVGSLEFLVVLSEHHPLASLARIPRARLLETSFVSWPRSVSPELMTHINRLLFDRDEHPSIVETADFSQATRLSKIAQGPSLAGIALPSDMELDVPGLVYRRLEDPAPLLEYGVGWLSNHISPYVPSFVEVARSVASVDG
jgi:DNA-binding transcriptional LysR family regulator